MNIKTPTPGELIQVLKDPNAAIQLKMRYLFIARDFGGETGLEILESALSDSSVLLAHEAAYLIGQLSLSKATPVLISLLKNPAQDCIVRHEAAEALAAIGDAGSIEIIKEYLNDSSAPVRETCYLALKSLNEKIAKEQVTQNSTDEVYGKFRTIDPIASIQESVINCKTNGLISLLMDETIDLYTRYQALFELRDRDDELSHSGLTAALRQDQNSALLRHEVAFVLGQIQSSNSLDALKKSLADVDEHPMVRHEAALALGSLGQAHAEIKQEI